jgi:hypothetical protein
LEGSSGVVRIGNGATDIRFQEGTFDSSAGVAVRPSPDSDGGVFFVDLGNGAGGGTKRFVVGSLAVGEGFVFEAAVDAGGDNVLFAAFGGTPTSQPSLSIGSGDELLSALGSTSGLSWVDDSGLSVSSLVQSVQTASFNATRPINSTQRTNYPVDTTTVAITATMDGTFQPGDTIQFTDYAVNFTTNALTVDFGSHNYRGVGSQTVVHNTDNELPVYEYIDSTYGFAQVSV